MSDPRDGGESAPAADDRPLLLLLLAEKALPHDLRAWAEREYGEVILVDDLTAAADRLREDGAVRALLIFLDRRRVRQALESCRTFRQVTSVPIVFASDEPVRAADRTRALEVGADDFLSGGIHLPELRSRIARAERDRGDRRRVPDARTAVSGKAREGPLTAEEFAREIRERLEGPYRSFCLIWLRGEGAANHRLGEMIHAHIRSGSGDFVGRLGEGQGVYLQDARLAPARSFVTRLSDALAEERIAKLDLEVLIPPADTSRIEELIRLRRR